MAKSRFEKTLADYVGIAFTPVLIMLLVGSLVFFLLELTYSGQWENRLRWILFWFVFASVLIGRIAIEQGSAYAAGFSLALAGATAVVIMRFVDGAIVALGLLGVVWWCTNKLTWDCTLIDDSEDASGEGLLQAAGIDEQLDADLTADLAKHQRDAVAEAVSHGKQDQPWWQRWLTDRESRERKAHAPGVWVLYFSLAALPLFGIGQLFIPASDTASRNFAFQLLWVYVASALGLLLMTSFLGLRRYLRQRRLQMPASMTGSWIAMGSALAVAILLLCIVLPRPDSDYSAMAAVDTLGEKAQEAWDKAFLDDDAGEGDGQRTGKPPEDSSNQNAGDKKDNAGTSKDSDQQNQQQAKDGQDSQQGSQSKTGKSSKQDGGSKKGNGKSGSGAKTDENSKKGGKAKDGDGQGPDDEKGKENSGKDGSKKNDAAYEQAEDDQEQADRNEDPQGDESAEQDAAQPTTPESPDSSSFDFGDSVGTIVKWAIYLAFALFVLYHVVRNWDRLVAAWQRFLEGLFGRADSSAEEALESSQSLAAKPRPFAAFKNPFLSRDTEKKPPAELLQYTFEALQAWASEHEFGRSPDQTPLEFADRLSERVKPIANEVQQTGQLYASLAYAGRKPSSECLPVLERIWKFLQLNAATIAAG